MNGAFTDAQLAAFLDGTMQDEALIDAIEAAINADPALAERAEALAGGDDPEAAMLRDAFAPIVAAPVPEHLAAIVTPAGAEVVDLAAARESRAPSLPVPANDTGGSRTWRWPQLAAMAACLAVGVMIGGPLLGPGSGAPAEGLVLASADLDAMLDTAPSGQTVDLAGLGAAEVVLTFRDTEGRLCRQFMLEADGATSDALACASSAGGWQVEAYGRRAAPAGEMKLAGGDAAPAVVAAVDAMIGSDPVVGEDEVRELGRK